jgi:hypothetical protein
MLGKEKNGRDSDLLTRIVIDGIVLHFSSKMRLMILVLRVFLHTMAIIRRLLHDVPLSIHCHHAR